MAGPTFEEWIFHLGLKQIHDPHFNKPVYRKPRFGERPRPAAILDFLQHLQIKAIENGHIGA